MKQVRHLEWIEPLDLATLVAASYQQDWIFLYSALNNKNKNSKSIIALFPKRELVSEDLVDLEEHISNEEKWFGYLSYELNQNLENICKTDDSFIKLPKIWLINFSLIFEFNHKTKQVKAYFLDEDMLLEVLSYKKISQESKIEVVNVSCNFSKNQYLTEIANIKQKIQNGDVYQVNLTRKIFGKLKDCPKSNFQIFKDLSEASPANYSSYLHLGNAEIISLSPELFLKIDKNGKIRSRPIKGTAPRDKNKIKDAKNKKNLKNSQKERAENLMIVDLVRNDLSKVCRAGSVKVTKLFAVDSYKTIHHMSSEVVGNLTEKYNVIDTIKACFPAGSMTGAPKVKAMQTINDAEKINRGIYSGSIGFLSQTEVNLSVVIRTLIIQENKFEFQVGGAITYDSDPNLEWQETLHKSKAINKILGIKPI